MQRFVSTLFQHGMNFLEHVTDLFPFFNDEEERDPISRFSSPRRHHRMDASPPVRRLPTVQYNDYSSDPSNRASFDATNENKFPGHGRAPPVRRLPTVQYNDYSSDPSNRASFDTTHESEFGEHERSPPPFVPKEKVEKKQPEETTV
ncbi:hypothetical protein HMI55_000228 [Coelomomyces lativittatus]|nr:hypothetical protein HMI55_000228 [Coelomomyces lativittatus]